MPTTPSPDRASKHAPLTKLTRSVLRRVNAAVNEFGLLADGDRVLAAVSGGKDSLSLLHLLVEHRRFFPIDFDLEVAHVVSDFAPDATGTRDMVAEVCDRYGVPCTFPDIGIMTDEQGNPCTPSCFWCAWNRRQALFDLCVRRGFTRLALGHHLDDVAETTLLNLAYHGTLETMLPKRAFFDGKFDVIRPLFYIRERRLADLARAAGFSAVTCDCPAAGDSKRRVMKDVVRGLARESKYLHMNLWRASRDWHGAFPDRPVHPESRDDGEEG